MPSHAISRASLEGTPVSKGPGCWIPCCRFLRSSYPLYPRESLKVLAKICHFNKRRIDKRRHLCVAYHGRRIAENGEQDESAHTYRYVYQRWACYDKNGRFWLAKHTMVFSLLIFFPQHEVTSQKGQIRIPIQLRSYSRDGNIRVYLPRSFRGVLYSELR